MKKTSGCRWYGIRRWAGGSYYLLWLGLVFVAIVLGYWYINLPIPEEIPSRSLKI